MGYWSVVEPYWESVDVYAEPDDFVDTFGAVPRHAGLLLAAHWCQSEVRNGGFHQFFTNPTGVLAPEAYNGFVALGRSDLAELLRSAMSFFGSDYPRQRDARCQSLSARTGTTRKDWDPFFSTDDQFYACLRQQTFEDSADAYATSNAGRLPKG
jgi:Domain of unknown function (DUF4375)